MIEVRSRNHGCRGKAIIIKYCECVTVGLLIQQVMRMRHIYHLWPLWLCCMFLHIS